MGNIIKSKFLDAEIQDVSTSISIVTIEQQWENGGDESDTHVEARDRRYSCLKKFQFPPMLKGQKFNFV